MAGRYHWFVAMVLSAVLLAAFFTGRAVEERALAAKTRVETRRLPSPPPTSTAELPTYQQLAVSEILKLPFAAFYEALRSAPEEARKKWANEVETMPDGPRRIAAVSAFYKLLVQFDPVTAAKTISEIKDKSLRSLALDCAVEAAPGFAMRTMAELCLTVKTERSFTKLLDVLADWLLIDPTAVAQFIDDHPNPSSDQSLIPRELISALASLDPKAAKEWMDKNGRSDDPSDRRAFIEGWYENDRAAAVSHVLAHAKDPEMIESVGDVLRGLYFDSKDEARKFIEDLPDDTTRHAALKAAFENSILGDEEETGDREFTPRALGAWLTQFPPAYWQGTLGEIFKWSKKAPETMLIWIQQQDPAIRAAVAAEYTPPFQKKTAEALMPVLQVPDPLLRDQLLRAVFKHMDGLPADARAALTAAPISAEQKNHALQILAAVEVEQKRERAE
jgi:hypothetical protein